jgi:hypothetical protein
LEVERMIQLLAGSQMRTDEVRASQKTENGA